MTNQYTYVGKTLTPGIAQELIKELFAGQTAQRQEIIRRVDDIHHERGGKQSAANRHHPVALALSAMKKSGLAKNLKRGSWFILPQIKTLSDFVKWMEKVKKQVEQPNIGKCLFRGLSNKDHLIEASAWRRLEHEEDRNSLERLLEINRDLIDEARIYEHDRKNDRELKYLEILAELQHFRAATCLIDFTYSAQVALWFACQSSYKKSPNSEESEPIDGKVCVVFDNPDRIEPITPELLDREIDSFFETDENGIYPLYQWQTEAAE